LICGVTNPPYQKAVRVYIYACMHVGIIHGRVCVWTDVRRECSRVHKNACKRLSVRLHVYACVRARVCVCVYGSARDRIGDRGNSLFTDSPDETRKRICPYDLRLAVSMQTWAHRVAHVAPNTQPASISSSEFIPRPRATFASPGPNLPQP